MISEAHHYTTFLNFARQFSEKVDVEKRWNEWLEFEGELITNYGNQKRFTDRKYKKTPQ